MDGGVDKTTTQPPTAANLQFAMHTLVRLDTLMRWYQCSDGRIDLGGRTERREKLGAIISWLGPKTESMINGVSAIRPQSVSRGMSWRIRRV